MSTMRLRAIRAAATLVVFAGLGPGSSAFAQTESGKTVRVARASVVLEQPRGDSIPVGSVKPGDVVEVLDRQGNWLLVRAPAAAAATSTWTRGWIHVNALEVASQGTLIAPQKPRGRVMIRGFGQAGGTLFSARDSFETILGGAFGPLFGGGAQVVFPNGAFVQGSFERFRDTGSRALVSGTQIFTVDSPERITVTPIQGTVGYRAAPAAGLTPYIGAGVGWYRLEEASLTPSAIDPVSDAHVGYHVVGGVEYPLAPWLWVAGEIGWATVPDLLGESGVSSLFGEDDLGGTTFRFKVIIGR